MSCKFEEIAKELKPHLGEDSNIEEAIKAAKEMSYANMVDIYNDAKAVTVRALNIMKPYKYRQAVEVTDIKKMSNDTYKISYKFADEGKVYTENASDISPFTFGDKEDAADRGYQATLENINRLYSDAEFMHESLKGFEEKVVYNLNNPEELVKLGEELGETSEISDWHKNKLMDGLKDITSVLKDAIPEMAIYLNKNSDRSWGALNIEADKMEMYVSEGPDTRYKSPLEVYAHEMWHAVTKYAIDSKDAALSGVLNKLKEVRKQFAEEVTAEQLASNMEYYDINEANKILDYLVNADTGLHEFVAHAMTNAAVMKTLMDMKVKVSEEKHKYLIDKLVHWASKLVEAVTGRIRNTDKNGYAEVVRLAYELAEANNRGLQNKKDGVMNRVIDTLGKAEQKVVDYAESKREALEAKDIVKPKVDAGALERGWFMTKMVARSMVDRRAKKYLEGALSLTGIKALRPENTIMSIVRDMSMSDNYQDVIERLGLIGKNIDQHRDIEFKAVAKVVKEAFKRKLEPREDIALTDVILDTDIGCLLDDPEIDLGELLQNGKALDSKIKEFESKLRDRVDSKDYNYYKYQTDGLARYMIKGTSNIVQQLNAYNIAYKIGTVGKLDEVEYSIVEDIDKLTTLKAIRLVDKTSRDIVIELINNEEEGVKTLIDYQIALKDKAERDIFNMPSDKMKTIKGYSKEIFDRDIDMVVAPLSDEKLMKSRGYKLSKVLEANKYHSREKELGFYVSTLVPKATIHSVTLRHTDMGRRGTTVTETFSIANEAHGNIKSATVINKMKLRALDVVREMENGTYVAEKGDGGVSPVLDNAGNIKDYRYMMNKEDKIDVLKMDRRAVNLIGRTYASTYDKAMTGKFNEQVMEIVEKDAEENYTKGLKLGKNMKEYVHISGNSHETDVRDMWRVLPKNIKEKYKDGFMLRRDLMSTVLGFRELSIGDAGIIKVLPEGVQYYARVAEHIWKEIVKVAKTNIVLKIPAVLIGNIVSNFTYSILTGSMPWTIAKLQLRGVRDLNAFMKNSHEVVKLERMIAAGKGNRVMEREVQRLKNDMNTNPVKDLMDEGFYMTIIEDLGLDEYNASNKITEMVENKLKGYPSIIQDGVNWLFLNERTAFFKNMNMATQYSDFVARYAEYHILINKGVSKDVAVKTVRDAFINYNKPDSKVVDYVNQMGAVMFTKYFVRIQKAINQLYRGHPLKAITALIAQEYLIGDIEDITDQSLIAKDYGHIYHDPLKDLMQAVIPSSFGVINDTEKLVARIGKVI